MWSRSVLAVVMTGISASDGLSATEELPKSCSQADAEKYGRPVMFELQRGIAFGVSARKTEFATNAGASAYIWLLNEWVAPQHTVFAENLPFSRKYGFSILPDYHLRGRLTRDFEMRERVTTTS
jgi:hypothetical protein